MAKNLDLILIKKKLKKFCLDLKKSFHQSKFLINCLKVKVSG